MKRKEEREGVEICRPAAVVVRDRLRLAAMMHDKCSGKTAGA